MMIRKKIKVEMIETEGLSSLLGDRVLLMCGNYFYEGVLEGIIEDRGDLCVKLSDAGIVYETGAWSDLSWKDRQQLPGDHYVRIEAIESFCLSPSVVLS